MPTVPTEFSPSVSVQPMQTPRMVGPSVVSGQNDTPQLIQKLGQDAQQTGGQIRQIGNSIRDQVQATVDDAQTKSAVNQFLQGALPVVSKYKTTQGVDALQQLEPAQGAIAQAKADARSTLTDPYQQRAFDMAVNEHQTMLGAQMVAHRDTEQVQYGKDQSKASAENLNTAASMDVAGRNRDDSNFAQLGQASDNETLHYAALSGIAPDSPQAQAALRLNRTDRYTSVITSLLDQHAPNEALDFFNDHKDEMDMKRAEVLGNAVKSAAQQEQVTAYRDQAVQSLQKTNGPGPLAQPIPAATISTTDEGDGLYIHEAPGRDVHAPASGTVTKVWNDDKLGLSAQIAMPNGYTATFNNLSAVNYKEGQRITQGQALGLTGRDSRGQGGVQYAITDPDGQYVDPRQASGSPFDPSNFSSPDDEAKAVSWINANVEDPVMQREAVDQVRRLANGNRAIEDQQYRQVKQQAVDQLAQNGGNVNALPAELKLQLHPADLQAFQQDYTDAQRQKNEVSLRASWIQDPTLQTVNAVKEAYQKGQLTDSGYLSALREAVAIQQDAGSADPKKVLPINLDNEQVKATLINNHLSQVANPAMGSTPEEKQALEGQQVLLFNHIRDVIDNEQTQTGRPLTRERKQQIIDQAVMDTIHVGQPGAQDGTSGGNQFSWQVQPAQMSNAYVTLHNGQRVNPSYIPRQVLSDIVNELRTNGLPLTQYNIANRWDQLGRPLR